MKSTKKGMGSTDLTHRIKPIFPIELLDASADERIAYFGQQTFRHPLLDEARNKLIDKIINPCGRQTINVFGPTGVGKSTLCTLFEKYYRDNADELFRRTQHSAPIILSTFAAEGLRFGWKDLYKEWLMLLNQMHPSIEIDFGVSRIGRNPNGVLIIENGVSVFELRRAAIAFTKKVKPLAIVIDEAPHIKKLGRGDQIEAQMDVLKSITDHTNTVLVLVGTYEMLNIINQNGQQGRRSRDLPLPRYKPDGDDWTQFEKVLRIMQATLPLHEPINLVSISHELYKGSLGCIGILKPWIHDTLATVIRAGKPTMTIDDLRAHKQKVKLLQVAREIRKGEDKMREDEQSYDDELDILLGIKPTLHK